MHHPEWLSQGIREKARIDVIPVLLPQIGLCVYICHIYFQSDTFKNDYDPHGNSLHVELSLIFPESRT